MKHIVVNGLSLEYRDIPATVADQPPLLLLHEGLGCIAFWRDFPTKLAARTGCRVIAWSRAGYGHSQPYPEARTGRYLHREAEEALPALLEALDVDQPVLIGHSDGGSISLIFAGAFPEAVRAIAVIAPHEFVEAETVAGILAAKTAWTATDWPHRLARYHADAQRVFSDWSDTWLAPSFANWSIVDYLGKIRCPVLAIQGEGDEYASMRQIDVIAEHAPDTQLLKLAHCGHTPQRDQEAAVLDALVALVNRVSGS